MSIFLAQTLLRKFSAKGIVPDHFVGSEYFLLAVAIGAGLTVIIATLTGFPISTTHALTGAISGCGLVAVGSQVNLAALGTGFVLPLLLSPVLASVMAGLLYMVGQYEVQWGPLSAGVILSTVPVAVLFSFLQRHLIHGLTAGAVIDDAVDGRVGGSRQTLEPAERRKPDARQLSTRAVRAVEPVARS